MWVLPLLLLLPHLAARPTSNGSDFLRLDEARAAALRTRANRVGERGDWLQIRDGELVRRRRGEEEILRAIEPWDAGEILGLARDPAGPTFVIARGGLFSSDPESDCLDPLELAEGAPPGSPNGVFVDARRRVWVTTDEAFGVIDPAFFWGRTISDGAGQPGGPYRLAFDGGDEPIVATPSGYYRYLPDRGARPRVVEASVDGAPVSAGSELAISYGQSIELAARGEALGGASLRWRLDGHHVWRPLEGATPIEELSPGRRVLDVIAIDRDLNRSEPFTLTLDVAYPRVYSPAVAGAIGGAVAFVLALVFGLRARRLRAPGRGDGRSALVRAALSTAIALGLLLQILAGCLPHARGWPFIGFGMYTSSFHEGDLIHEGVLVGLDRRGRPRSLPYLAAGVATDGRWNVLRALIDGGEVAGESLIANFNARRPGQQLIGVQVRSRRVRLTEHGPVRIAPLVLSHYRRPDTESGGADD